jgi:hypothetical protein
MRLVNLFKCFKYVVNVVVYTIFQKCNSFSPNKLKSIKISSIEFCLDLINTPKANIMLVCDQVENVKGEI